MNVRKKAVLEGRAFVRVRGKRTGDLATIGVCPACWNLPSRRLTLLAQLSRMGLVPVHREDLAEGVYRARSIHAPGCRFSHIPADPWERLRKAIKEVKRK